MTYEEYINNGGIIPSDLFDLIPPLQNTDFDELFALKFNKRNIACDSDNIITDFESKLRSKAFQLCPFYAERITIISNALANPFEKTSSRSVTNNADVRQYDTPTNAQSVESNNVSSASKSNGVATETFTGVSDRNDKINLVIAYQDNIKNQYKLLLSDFESLFLGVF